MDTDSRDRGKQTVLPWELDSRAEAERCLTVETATTSARKTEKTAEAVDRNTESRGQSLRCWWAPEERTADASCQKACHTSPWVLDS